jgi:2-polyprenyl-6-methoxyphenol hydroxylase-like FAD-dependent oxidoreductase
MNRETNVLIVGAGPVGLTLAMDLARRGIDVIVAEMRRADELPRVRCNHVSARSMEIFRRLGVAQSVRSVGLPADFPNDVAFRTTVTGIEFARIAIPSRNQRYAATDGPDTWWPTPEPPHRANQIFFEPVLLAHATAQSRIRILHHSVLEDFSQSDSGVVAELRDLGSGVSMFIGCDYLVGCDGGKSTVRKKIGASLVGTPVVQRVQSTYFRSPQLLSRMPAGPAWLCQIFNPRRCGTVFAIDGRETWIVHNFLDEHEGLDSIDRDWAIRTILGVDSDFRYEAISHEDWVGRRLVADRFRDRRAFICGDAAHLWIANAGYGMNAGLADAADLSWQLAAVLNGWASPTVLDAYAAERRPITEQVSRFAMGLALKTTEHRRATPAEIEMPGAVGDAVRARIGREVSELNVQQYCCGGLNFGYFYDTSPIIAYDGEPQPGYTMYDFASSSVPGCRAPHFWLRHGRSLYDELGPEYTLLRLDPNTPSSRLTGAAARRGLPLAVIDVQNPDAQRLYARNLVLVRPDQHVAWRGDHEPTDALALIDLVRGASSMPARACVA